MGGLFFRWGTNLFGQIYGGRGVALHGRIIDHIYTKGMGSFKNAFSSSLNTINLNIFPKHSGISKDLSLRLIVTSFQMLCHVQFPSCWPWSIRYWHIIWKVNTRNRGLNLESIFCTPCLWGGDFIQSLSSFLIFLAVTGTLMSWL